MFPTELDLLARQERSKDWYREAAREQLIHEAGLRPSGLGDASWQVANWIGVHIVKLGTKLHLL